MFIHLYTEMVGKNLQKCLKTHLIYINKASIIIGCQDHREKTLYNEDFLFCYISMFNSIINISKLEWNHLCQTSFCNVTSNNSSSGLREKLYLPNTHLLAPKYGGKIWHH